MDPRPNRVLDRVGAAGGIAAVALLLALFMVFPTIPSPNKGIDAIARSVATDRNAHLLAAYLGTVMSGALVVFGVAVAADLRRSDVRDDGWWMLALAGITVAGAIGIVADAFVIVLVRAVGHGVGGNALWLAYGGDHWLGALMGLPIAIFLLGVGMGSRATRLVPRWLSWAAIALAAAFTLGAGSVAGDEVDGGPLGVVLFVGYLGLLVWIVGVSVVLWRRSASGGVEMAASLA